MSAPLKEQFANSTQTTLNGSINNSTTSVVVTDGSVFPSVGNFRVKCESEIMLVTARSSNTLTVVRGQEGTSGASHADLSKIALILTDASINQYNADYVPLWGYSSQPALNKLVADDGSTILAASDFTWQNQGSASKTDQAGTILLRAPTATGENLRILERTAPSAPYSYIGALRALLIPGSGSIPLVFFGFRESSTSKVSAICLSNQNNGGFWVDGMVLSTYKWTNSTTFSGTGLTVRFHGLCDHLLWFKIEDDNTNLKFYVGDGIEWVLVQTESRTGHMAGGPNRIIWGINNYNNSTYEQLARLVHWSRAS